MAIARSAEASGATIRTGADVVSIDVSGGRTIGVTLAGGEVLRARVWCRARPPRPRCWS